MEPTTKYDLINENRTEQVRITKPEDQVRLVMRDTRRRPKVFLVITLDGASHVIKIHLVTIGLVNRTTVHPREVIIAPSSRPSDSRKGGSLPLRGGWTPASLKPVLVEHFPNDRSLEESRSREGSSPDGFQEYRRRYRYKKGFLREPNPSHNADSRANGQGV